MPDVIQWGNPPAGYYNLPLHVGRERGTFAPAEEMVLTENENGAAYAKLLVAGQYDMGQIGTPPALTALSQTDDYVIVGQGLFRRIPFTLVVDSTVSKHADLQGRTIALNDTGTCPHSVVTTALRQNGVDLEQIAFLSARDADGMLDASMRGDVAGAVIWEPYASRLRGQLGWHTLDRFESSGRDSDYGFLLYARRALWEKDPDRVLRIVSSYQKNVAMAKAQPDLLLEAATNAFPWATKQEVADGLWSDVTFWNPDTALDRDLLCRAVLEYRRQNDEIGALQTLFTDGGVDLSPIVARPPTDRQTGQ